MKLQEWANANNPDDNLKWKDSFWRQIIFVRDTIPRVLWREGFDPHKWFEEYSNIDDMVQVISTHTSKSIKCPVYQLKFRGMTFTMRDNFYDWKVSVTSRIPLDIDFEELFDGSKEIHHVYCEGMSEVYGAFDNNKSKFTIELSNDKELWFFFKKIWFFMKKNDLIPTPENLTM